MTNRVKFIRMDNPRTFNQVQIACQKLQDRWPHRTVSFLNLEKGLGDNITGCIKVKS